MKLQYLAEALHKKCNKPRTKVSVIYWKAPNHRTKVIKNVCIKNAVDLNENNIIYEEKGQDDSVDDDGSEDGEDIC